MGMWRLRPHGAGSKPLPIAKCQLAIEKECVFNWQSAIRNRQSGRPSSAAYRQGNDKEGVVQQIFSENPPRNDGVLGVLSSRKRDDRPRHRKEERWSPVTE